MEATVNKQAAINGYAAFGAMDPEGAMKDISDAIEWVVGGDNALTGSYKGKEAVGGFWMKLVEKGFTTTPKEFIAEGNRVVVLCDVELDGDRAESLDLLSYNDDGQLVRFETFGGEAQLDRAFPR
jgi:ketosteroid isomerase-like protein